MRIRSVVMFLVVVSVAVATAQEPATPFQAWIQNQARQLRSHDQPPATQEEWQQRKAELRANLARAWGSFPASDCDLEPRILGQFQRDGYRVEKLVLQTRPGIWMTANAYVPDKPGKLPAILHVHGHWAGAKQDPVVQSRCIGCAKLGFFVLCVDAFGAGERGVEPQLGEYHGEMTAATLFPVGLPLSGLQVYENKRAVDYLQTRPEVNPDQIGITGASGGGNQTMYAGAFDERVRCVVPTCSVGTYQAYLSAACCMCEVVPGALRFTEEGDVLGLAANRGLMVTSATKDAYQFSVGEARKSFGRAESIAHLISGSAVRHTIIESPHAYNQPMREAMYGWMAFHLKHEGSGEPIPDPTIVPEEPESLRCYPGLSRPDDFVTIPRFAAAEAARLAESRVQSNSRDDWNHSQNERRQKLINVLGGQPQPSDLHLQVEADTAGQSQQISFDTELELRLVARRDLPEKPGRLAILIDIDGGAEAAWGSPLAQSLRAEGWTLVTPELRATGRFADPRDPIKHAPDHNTAEWSLWIGRPLLGQWAHDVRRTLDAIADRDGSLPHDIMIVGSKSSAVVALSTAALDERITRVKVINTLGTFATDRPYRGLRLGIMAPGILRDVGDVADIASLVAPRPTTIQGAVNGSGELLSPDEVKRCFEATKRIFDLVGASTLLVFEAPNP